MYYGDALLDPQFFFFFLLKSDAITVGVAA